MKKILIVSNCLSMGYTKSIKSMRPDDKVDFCVHSTALSGSGPDASSYDVVFISTAFRDRLSAKQPAFLEGKKVCLLPNILFYGFHPDCCYLTDQGKVVKLLGQDYHSSLVFFGFKHGLSVDETIGLFQPNVLNRLGVAETYQREKQTLLNTFREHGLDLDKRFAKWSRTGCFMHTVNHPRVDVVYDIARESLRVNDMEAVTHSKASMDNSPLFPDNLIGAPVLPVMPAVAANLGLNGNTSYKFFDDIILSQRDYIAAAYELYASLDIDNLKQMATRMPIEQLESLISLPERRVAS